MADYASRMESAMKKFLSEVAERKVDQLVANNMMSDQQVHQHRGYIAATKEFLLFIINDLPKKLNEE